MSSRIVALVGRGSCRPRASPVARQAADADLALLGRFDGRGATSEEGSTLMSYVHRHFGSDPVLADHLVDHASGPTGRPRAPVTVTSAQEEPRRG